MKRLNLNEKNNVSSKNIVIVAMGDSLTAGHLSSNFGLWANPAPYTVFLEERLKEWKSLKFDIHNRGVSGQVTEEMIARFDRDVLNLKPNIVIILGGTNDMGWGISPKDVFKNLSVMYETASENEIETIACSIPSILGFDSLIPSRIELNSMIRLYCIREKVAFADIFNATADPKTKRLLNEYSGDGLHLSKSGYRKMADTIFSEALERLLKKTFN